MPDDERKKRTRNMLNGNEEDVRTARRVFWAAKPLLGGGGAVNVGLLATVVLTVTTIIVISRQAGSPAFVKPLWANDSCGCTCLLEDVYACECTCGAEVVGWAKGSEGAYFRGCNDLFAVEQGTVVVENGVCELVRFEDVLDKCECKSLDGETLLAEGVADPSMYATFSELLPPTV